MSKFCQVENNKVWWIFEADKKPEFHPLVIILDITDVNPQPKEGWNYDKATNTFSEPSASIELQQRPVTQEQIEEIKANQLTLMDAIAQMYEDMLTKGTV
jgi:hypothetical protein